MRGRLALAGYVLVAWLAFGFLPGWAWYYCCAIDHAGVLFVIAGTLQGVLGGILYGGWVIAGKLMKPLSIRSSILVGTLTAVPFTGFACFIGMCSELMELSRNQYFLRESVGLLLSPMVNGIVLALLSVILVRLISMRLEEVRIEG